MIRWGRLAIASALLGVAAAAAGTIWRGGLPLWHPRPWLPLGPGVRDAYSSVLGLAVGALVVLATRGMVGRFDWAKSLHSALRPLARGMTSTGIVLLALLSSVGEEMLFRGLLAPWIGLVPQAIIFGLAHQIPGKSRWVWASWATAMGLLLGAMFQLTGSLAGPVMTHALVNGLNLFYLKRHDPSPPRRRLGGLLGQRG
jgi:membrane protease YdiL (CAAX protease family)